MDRVGDPASQPGDTRSCLREGLPDVTGKASGGNIFDGEYDEALVAAREMEKRYPGSEAVAGVGLMVRAARGDVEAVRAWLEDMAAPKT